MIRAPSTGSAPTVPIGHLGIDLHGNRLDADGPVAVDRVARVDHQVQQGLPELALVGPRRGDVAREIDMGAVLKLGRSEMLSGGRRKQALLGDAIEAIIAAVYMDGGFDAARDLIIRLWGDRVQTVKQDARDAKTALQEWAQARGFPPPSYVQTDRQGPDHAPVFTITAKVQNGASAVAVAPSKRQAEQAAAKLLLAKLENNT